MVADLAVTLNTPTLLITGGRVSAGKVVVVVELVVVVVELVVVVVELDAVVVVVGDIRAATLLRIVGKTRYSAPPGHSVASQSR
jgi:hypothetical protein